MTDQQPITTNRDILTNSAYARETHLAARQSLYQFQWPRFDVPQIVAAIIDKRQPQTPKIVVDVGCGNGTYLTPLRSAFTDAQVVGIDLAPGILAPLPRPVICGDAAQLPFGDDSIDVLLAMHMIYHLSDIPAGLRELRRVLRPGGLIITSTNSEQDKAELGELWSRAAATVLNTATGPQRLALSHRYRLEDATEVLTTAGFTDIATQHLKGTITISTPDPVVAHLQSYESFAAETNTPFAPTMRAVERELAMHLKHNNAFTISCHGGITHARKPV